MKSLEGNFAWNFAYEEPMFSLQLRLPMVTWKKSCTDTYYSYAEASQDVMNNRLSA